MTAARFILRNHNGTLLAIHSEYAALTAEMVKYESWTGNGSRLTIAMEGSPELEAARAELARLKGEG